jgi:hypothetical protein
MSINHCCLEIGSLSSTTSLLLINDKDIPIRDSDLSVHSLFLSTTIKNPESDDEGDNDDGDTDEADQHSTIFKVWNDDILVDRVSSRRRSGVLERRGRREGERGREGGKRKGIVREMSGDHSSGRFR